MNIGFVTLGCKVNQAETESLVRAATQEGYHVVQPSDPADVFVVNTCTVTATADAKTRQLLRRLHRDQPRARILVIGCYVERNPREVAAIEGVDLLISRRETHTIMPVLRRWLGAPAHTRDGSQPPLRTRALVKVQDGCSLGCTYCIVPKVRGPAQSRSIVEVIHEVAERVDEGFCEVVLVGIHIGSYCDNGYDISRLVDQILSKTELPRLRLTSLHPNDALRGLLSKFVDSRLCPHLHVALQSGSNRVLQAMGRHYSVEEFCLAVAEVTNTIPDIALTTDIIVGYPGETDEDFEQTLSVCRRLPFSRIHVFPFSARPGTPAAHLAPVADSTKAERKRRLLDLANEKQARYHRAVLGRDMPVLWEEETRPGVWTGFTPNYMRVFCSSRDELKGRTINTKLQRQIGCTLWGRPDCSLL